VLHSSLCRHEDFLSPWYRDWATRLGLPVLIRGAENAGPLIHRKHWEYCAIAQALHERGMLRPGRTGCGFAVGREPLSSVFAALGTEILATDQAPESAGEIWTGTGQHAASLESVYVPELINRKDFDARVRFRSVDMRDLRLPWSETFDFIWSSCSIEHLGSLEAGERFVLEAMALVKPGGIAVHTTEFNLASNEGTLVDEDCVIYRRRDIEALDLRLRAAACGLSRCDFVAGDDINDINFDYPPYGQNGRPHISLLFRGHVATSLLLIIRKGMKGDGITVWDAPNEDRAGGDPSGPNENMAILEAELAAARESIADLECRLSAMHHSTSWRVTSPLRLLKRWIARG
jgi:SAM-dependent methyltransferase